jgi:hypothetical protein
MITAKAVNQCSMLAKSTRVLSDLVASQKRVLVFTTHQLTRSTVSDLWVAGVPAIPLEPPFGSALNLFESLESGVLVAPAGHCLGWRVKAAALVFLRLSVSSMRPSFFQQLHRIVPPAEPIFIDCSFVNEMPN